MYATSALKLVAVALCLLVIGVCNSDGRKHRLAHGYVLCTTVHSALAASPSLRSGSEVPGNTVPAPPRHTPSGGVLKLCHGVTTQYYFGMSHRGLYAYEPELSGKAYANLVAKPPPPTFYFGTPMRTRQVKRKRDDENTALAVQIDPRGRYKWPRGSARLVEPNAPTIYQTVPRTRGVYGQGEMKYFDCEMSFALPAITTTWANTVADPTAVPVANINCLFCPTQGAAINQRIGRECKVYKIKIRGQLIVNATDPSTTNSNHCRVLLVQDKQTNGTQMTGVQLLDGGTSTEYTIDAYQALTNFGRFQVLKDKTVIFSDLNFTDSAPGGTILGARRAFKMNWNFSTPVSVHFNATNGGTIADIVDNSFHLVAARVVSDMTVSMVYKCRVCYKE